MASVRSKIQFGSEKDLIDHLLNQVDSVSFMFGSALSLRVKDTGFGVPDAGAMVDMIRLRLDESDRAEYDATTGASTMDRYQAAMMFLERARGAEAVHKVVSDAVMLAFRTSEPPHELHAKLRRGHKLTAELVFATMEEATDSWVLNSAIESFGKLVMVCGRRFGQDILTTNFDPLIEVAIRRAGGSCFRVALAEDGNLDGIVGDVPRVIHLHGFYYGTRNLHTVPQLTARRPHLKRSLEKLLRNRVLVVVGYGGWNDILMRALRAAVRAGTIRKVLWTFFEKSEDEALKRNGHVIRTFGHSARQDHVQFFTGIDVHEFMPKLYGICGYQRLIEWRMLDIYLREASDCVDSETAIWREIVERQFPNWRVHIESELGLEDSAVGELRRRFSSWSADEWEKGLQEWSLLLFRSRLGAWVVPPLDLPEVERLARKMRAVPTKLTGAMP